MKMIKCIAAACLAAISITSANAAVRYDFTAYSASPYGGEQITGGGLSYERSNFLAATTQLPVANLTSCFVSTTKQALGGCNEQDLVINSFYNIIGFHINTTLNPSTWFYFYFSTDAFGSIGTYNTLNVPTAGIGKLVVSNIAAAVPESTTWAMMLVGFGAIGAAMRRRSASPISLKSVV